MGDPTVAFAMAAERESRKRELKRWEATWDHLKAIQKTIAKAFGG